MVNLKWDLHNWITIILMVAIVYAGVGLVKSLIAGGGMSAMTGGGASAS